MNMRWKFEEIWMFLSNERSESDQIRFLLIKAQKILVFKSSENKVVYGDLLHGNICTKCEL